MIRTLVLVLGLLLVPFTPLRAEEPGAVPMQRRATEAQADRLLDDSLLTNPDKRARALAILDQPAPPSGEGAIRGQILFERGNAALQLGRQAQAARELEEAAELLRGTPERGEALSNQAQALLNIGQVGRALAALKQANREETAPGIILRNLALITEQYGRLGNITETETANRQCQDLALRMQSDRADRNPTFAMWRRINSLRCETSLLMAQGRIGEMEAPIRRIIAAYEEAPSTRASYVLGNRYVQLADLLRAQGRLADAENEARTALAIYQRTVGPGSQRTGSGLLTLGRIIAEQGRVKEGEALARKGIEVIQGAGVAGNGAARVTLADILAMDYRWKEVRENFELAASSLSQETELVSFVTRRNPNFALALIKTGDAEKALQTLDSSLQEALTKWGEASFPAAMARGLKAMALASLGRSAEAEAEFAAAVPVLITQENDEDQETGNRARDQRLRLVLESYMDLLVRTRPGPETAATTFRLADAARGRTVQRALAASATRAAAGNPALADQVRRAQDAEKQMAALSGLLANTISARAEDQDPAQMDSLRIRIEKLRGERNAVLKAIAERFPEYGRILNPQPYTVFDIQRRLKPDEAMLAFYSAEDRTYAWAVPANGPAVMAQTTQGRLALDAQVKKLRQALDLSVGSIEEIPEFDLNSAAALYGGLIQPTEAAWAQAATLFTVPHGPLGLLPLGLLPTRGTGTAAPAPVPAPGKDKAKAAPTTPGPLFARYRHVPWLIRKTAIAQLPSVGALATLRTLPQGRPERRAFIAFGDPLFSRDQALEAAGDTSTGLVARGAYKRRAAPRQEADFTADLAQLPRLPDTALEVRGIAEVLGADPEKDLFLQARASEAAVRKSDLTGWKVVMFATHGLIPGDLAGLDQPALALSSPDVAGDGSSGVLTMERIMGLRLDADWVVLSACNTAAGEGSGAEAVSGLGRAFFYAGARALLVSNWPVETTSARMLTTDLFRLQATEPGLSRAQAVRGAMLGLMDGPGPRDEAGREMFTYAHPTFWAPFSLVGDGG